MLEKTVTVDINKINKKTEYGIFKFELAGSKNVNNGRQVKIIHGNITEY